MVPNPQNSKEPTAPTYTVRTARSVMNDLIEDIKARKGHPELPTGIAALDELIWGIHKKEVQVFAARTSQGKCLGRGTPVMMHNGDVKPVEEIKVGDKLMGPDSKPRTVASTITGEEEIYEIQQRNGLWYTANSSHILSLQKTGDVNYSKYNGKITSKRQDR